MSLPSDYIPGYHAYPGGPPMAALHAEWAAAEQRAEDDRARAAAKEVEEQQNLLLLAP